MYPVTYCCRCVWSNNKVQHECCRPRCLNLDCSSDPVSICSRSEGRFFLGGGGVVVPLGEMSRFPYREMFGNASLVLYIGRYLGMGRFPCPWWGCSATPRQFCLGSCLVPWRETLWFLARMDKLCAECKPQWGVGPTDDVRSWCRGSKT